MAFLVGHWLKSFLLASVILLKCPVTPFYTWRYRGLDSGCKSLRVTPPNLDDLEEPGSLDFWLFHFILLFCFYIPALPWNMSLNTCLPCPPFPPPAPTHGVKPIRHPQNECGGQRPRSRILLAAQSPALRVLCTQRQPKSAHVFQRLPPPAPLQGPKGNSAKIIISNWGFVPSAGKTSPPFRIIRPCYCRLAGKYFSNKQPAYVFHICRSLRFIRPFGLHNKACFFKG